MNANGEAAPSDAKVVKILVADDNATDRAYYRAALGYAGYEVLEAADGAEALEMVRCLQPDLVFTDLTMPNLDGYALAQAIRADGQIAATRVIFCSAVYGSDEARQLAAAIGAERFLTKPVDLHDLLATIKEILGSDLPSNASTAPKEELEQAHLHLLNDKLVAKLAELEAEIAERQAAEKALRESESRLEKRVEERTAELRRSCEELKRMGREVEEAQSQLLQSEKMASIGQLAAGVAHEINNPIGFVGSNLGTLQRYFADLLRLVAAYEQAEALLPAESPITRAIAEAKAKADLDYLKVDLAALLKESRDGVARVKGIVQDLKDFSRVGDTEWAEADLHEGLDSTLNVVWHELKYKADVIKEYGDLPAVKCMASQLNQVFMNLLVNAAQAIEQHGTITIRTGTDQESVWVEIADTGKGISPDHLPRIFDPFFTTKPVGIGTGLGLSISYGIVRRHGGTLEVTSEIGKGSTFRIALPCRQAEAADGLPPQSTGAPA